MTEIICPYCNELSAIDDALRGQTVVCGHCGKDFRAEGIEDEYQPVKVQLGGTKKRPAPSGKDYARPLRFAGVVLAIVAGLFGILYVAGVPILPEDRAIAEREAETERLKAERITAALALREEVIRERKWDQLFEEKIGTPTDITIDPDRGVDPGPWTVDLEGTAEIDGTKYEFSLKFRREWGKPETPLLQDEFKISKWEPKKPVVSSGEQSDAWAYIQLFVEQRLKSPGNAKFPFGGHRSVQSLGGGRYKVRSYVDSTNSFGAKVRTHFECVVKRRSGGWDLESLNFD